MPFRVIITGSQWFDNYEQLKDYCDRALAKREHIEIVAATQKGAGVLGMKYAKERGHGLKVFKPDFTGYGAGAITVCFKEMVNYADAIIVFWDGELKTVATAIRMAEKKGIPVREVKVQKPVPPPKIKASKSPAVALSPEHKERYAAAHQKYQRETTPAAYKDFGALPTQFPKTNTANGLTTFITKYLDWMGYYSNRINTVGREINQKYVDGHGKVHITRKWITGTTKKGTADIAAIINGLSVSFEVKIGSDRPSEDQLKQKTRIERAGGKYFFVHSAEEFFAILDGLGVV